MKANNKGFGLIELMVSILVASIIVTGLYSLLTSSVVSFGFSSASNKTSQSARQINNLFETLVMQSGFINYKRAYSYQGFQKRAGEVFGKEPEWEENQFVYIDSLDDSDELYIRFFGASYSDDIANTSASDEDADGFVFDCTGNTVSNRKEMYLRFYVNDYTSTSGDKGLFCQQYYIDEKGVVSGPVGPYLIDKSVASLRFLVSSNTSSVNSKGFFSAKAVNDGAGDAPKWKDVSMLKYGIVVAQGTGQKLAKTNSDRLNLPIFTQGEFGQLSNDMQYTIKSEDRAKMHRVITGNISLVNKICLGGSGC